MSIGKEISCLVQLHTPAQANFGRGSKQGDGQQQVCGEEIFRNWKHRPRPSLGEGPSRGAGKQKACGKKIFCSVELETPAQANLERGSKQQDGQQKGCGKEVFCLAQLETPAQALLNK
jgi:hypothetical protein